MSHTNSEIPYSVFEPLTEDFTSWENSLAELFVVICPDLNEAKKVAVQLEHLPDYLRVEAISESVRPISYQNMVEYLRANYARPVFLLSFYSCMQGNNIGIYKKGNYNGKKVGLERERYCGS